MSDLEKQILDALAKLGERHGITRQPADLTRSPESYRDKYPLSTVAASRPAVVDMRDSLARLQSKPARTAVNKSERDYEGRYATVTFPDAVTAVYVDTVERRTTGVKAYVLRLDNRTRCYVLLELLADVRDAQ